MSLRHPRVFELIKRHPGQTLTAAASAACQATSVAADSDSLRARRGDRGPGCPWQDTRVGRSERAASATLEARHEACCGAGWETCFTRVRSGMSAVSEGIKAHGRNVRLALLRETVSLGGGATPRSRAPCLPASECLDLPGLGRRLPGGTASALCRRSRCTLSSDGVRRSGGSGQTDHPIRFTPIVVVLRGTSGLWRHISSEVLLEQPGGSRAPRVFRLVRTVAGWVQRQGGQGRGDAARLPPRKTSEGHACPGGSGPCASARWLMSERA